MTSHPPTPNAARTLATDALFEMHDKELNFYFSAVSTQRYQDLVNRQRRESRDLALDLERRLAAITRERDHAVSQHESAASKLWDAEQRLSEVQARVRGKCAREAGANEALVGTPLRCPSVFSTDKPTQQTGNWNPSETPGELAARLVKIREFQDAVNEAPTSRERGEEISELTVGSNFTITNSGLPAAIIQKPIYNITFSNASGKIGELCFNGPALVFTGNAEESAKVFFDWIAKSFAGRLAEERTLATAGRDEREAKDAQRYRFIRCEDTDAAILFDSNGDMLENAALDTAIDAATDAGEG